MSTYYKPGSWNCICDVCGFKFKAFEMRKRWDGLMVCDADFEQDHPQKYLRVTEDDQTVPWVRSEPEDNFIQICYLYAISSYADLAEADCAKADNTQYSYQFLVGLRDAGVV